MSEKQAPSGMQKIILNGAKNTMLAIARKTLKR